MTDRLVLGVFLCGGRPQVSLTRQDEKGAGDGYRLLGPSFNGTSELLQNKILSEQDAAEIRRYLDAVFPQPPGTLGESQRFQVEEARDILGAWDETRPHSGRETVLAEQVRHLLAIIDQAFPAGQGSGNAQG